MYKRQLVRYAPEATLTSIEIDPEHMRQARAIFSGAGVPGAQLRLIEGDASQAVSYTHLRSGRGD